MKNRDDIRDQFSPLLDGELPPEERAAMEAALSDDAELLRELDNLKRVDDLYRGLPPVTAPSGFEQAVRDRVRPSHVAAATAPRRPVARRLWPGLAAAAVVLVSVGAVLFGLNRSTAPGQLAANFDRSDEKLAETPASQTDATTLAYGGAPAAEPAVRPNLVPKDQPSVAADSADMVQHRFRDEEDVVAQSVSPDAASEAKKDANGEFLRVKRKLGGDMPEIATRMDREKVSATPEENVARTDTSQIASTSDAAPMPASPQRDDLPMREAESIERQPTPAAEMTAKAGLPLTTAPAPPKEGMIAAAPPVSGGSKSRAAATEAPKTMRVAREAEKKESATRAIGKRTFTLRNGVWYEAGYADQSIVAIDRNSQAAQDFLEQHADAKEVFVLKEPVVFMIADRWYKFSAAVQ